MSETFYVLGWGLVSLSVIGSLLDVFIKRSSHAKQRFWYYTIPALLVIIAALTQTDNLTWVWLPWLVYGICAVFYAVAEWVIVKKQG